MEDIIKELYDYLEGRINPDLEIILNEMIKVDCEIKNNESDSFRQLCYHHRFVDLTELIVAYTNFRDRIAKVIGNIEYDKNHHN